MPIRHMEHGRVVQHHWQDDLHTNMTLENKHIVIKEGL